MNPPLEETMAVCPDCGAMQSRILVPCWLCGRPLGPENLILPAEVIEPPNQVAETVFAGMTGLLVLFALVVGLGFVSSEPEGSILYFLVVVPALAITIIRASVRSSSGEFSWGDTLLTLILSTVGVFAALMALGFALVMALLVICLSKM